MCPDAKNRPIPLFTIGHSTRPIDEFVELLRANGVKLLIDIRTIPESRRGIPTEGEEVSDGTTLVILESMKMEIPVLAEEPGTVTKLAVAEGDVIQEGDLIAIIE